MITFENSKRKIIRKPGKVNLDTLCYYYPIQQPSTFWTRKALDRVGYLDEDLHYTLDWDYFFRMSGYFEPGYLPETLSVYHRHSAHKTGSGSPDRDREILGWAEKHAPEEWQHVYKAMYELSGTVRLVRKVFKASLTPWVLKTFFCRALAGVPIERVRTVMRMF